MPEPASALPETPDESRDVIVYFTERAATSADSEKVWTVWRGQKQEAEFSDQYEALRYARTLADEHHLPAWKIGREWEGLVRLGE